MTRSPFRRMAFSALRRLLYLWVRSETINQSAFTLKLDRSKPGFYVLQQPSVSDLAVVDRECTKAGLPRPVLPVAVGEHIEPAAFFYLTPEPDWFGRQDKRGISPTLDRVVSALSQHAVDDAQIVPVSVFWGQSPDRETSAWKLLFADSWAVTGRLRRLVSILILGRKTRVQFSTPIHLRELVEQDKGQERTLRMVHRILRVHFRNQKAAVIGPDVSHRRNLVKGLVHDPMVRQAIAEEAEREKISLEKAEAQALRYGNEIASDYTYTVIRFLELVLSWFWNKIYDGIKVHNVEGVRDIVLEIAREEGMRFRAALIRSEQDKAYLQRRLTEGRILPLDPAPPLDAGVIERSAHIVGAMGHEPIVAAIEAGAQIILCGRATDTSLFAAVPVMRGAGEGPAWHAAKTLECGTAATAQRKRPDSIFAWVRDDHFDIAPLDPESRCTPQSVAAHTLYENADPFLITEPSGTIDTSTARYTALDDRTVRVSGSTFRHADRTTIKLEGAELAGYQSVIVAGIREPFIIRQLDTWLEAMQQKFADRVQEVFRGRVAPDGYAIRIRVYGRDGVMGRLEPRVAEVGHEVGLVITVTAAEIDQSLNRVARNFNQTPEQFRETLTKLGSSERSLRRQIEGELAWQRLLRRRVEPFVNVGDEEVKSIIARLEASKGSEEYHLKEIYLSATPDQMDEV
ncbi:MAG: acyclic terpene utilization AtuA family protein, partial [Pseudomonas sp.]|nr:acyclic terpene utilization AtuA family protein [Pseudomonas sp.]